MTIYKGNQIIAGGTLPDQTGKSGKYLKTDGSNPSWESVDALPSQSGQNGKYLTTNGTQASWATIQQAPSTDNTTINQNSSNQLQAIGVIDGQTGNADKFVSLTKAQYDALATKDADTFYNITDDSDTTLDLLQTIYPVGATYFTQNNTCPLSALFGTWQLQASTTLVTDVSISSSSIAPVKGNGSSMYFSNTYVTPATNLPMYVGTDGNCFYSTSTNNQYVQNLQLTTDSTKSGIVADTSNLITTTKQTINMNIFVRIA